LNKEINMHIILLLICCYHKDKEDQAPVLFPPPAVESAEDKDTGEELDISTKEAAEQDFEGWCLSGT